jgi:signal recognition particle subunit SRP72
MAADLTSLLRKATITSHDEVLKAANNALKKSKTDAAAQHARVTALLKLDRYDDAVRAFDEAGAQLKDSARLEYAYALYKAGQLEKAEEVAGSAKSGGAGRGIKHVLAQTTYRLEKFDESASLYAELADGSPAAAGEGNDLRINAAAVDAQLEWQAKGHLVAKKQPAREDLEAFETAYNAACGAIARGELAKGEVLLRRARDLCLASEDLSEEEKEGEMVPIVVQVVYVLLRLGRLEEAKKVAEQAEVDGGTDEATKWIAKVNGLVADGGSANAFLTHRMFNSGPKLEGSDKPFKYQADILQQDGIIMDLLSSKHVGVIRSTSSSLKDSSEATISPAQNTISVLNAAAHAKGQTNKAGLKALLPLLEQRPNDVGLLLTVVQLYLLTNNYSSAISLLESFFSRLEQSKSSSDLDVRFAPGLVGVLVSLYNKQNRKASIKTELSRAASYWRSRRKEDTSIPLPVSLLREAGTALLESRDVEDAKSAAEMFKDLHDLDPNDRASTAGLVASLALTSPRSISKSTLETLNPAKRLISDIDASALEAAGIPSIPSLTTTRSSSKKRVVTTKAAPSATKKKVRISKKRMPKEFVEGKEMDKERWLPLRDRSYWRPKGKKGKKRGQDLTQGGAVDEGKVAAPAQQQQGGGSGGGGGKNKGKKKKR